MGGQHAIRPCECGFYPGTALRLRLTHTFMHLCKHAYRDHLSASLVPALADPLARAARARPAMICALGTGIAIAAGLIRLHCSCLYLPCCRAAVLPWYLLHAAGMARWAGRRARDTDSGQRSKCIYYKDMISSSTNSDRSLEKGCFRTGLKGFSATKRQRFDDDGSVK